MKLGDKVTIGGRTMLRPGFSLVGLTGRIVASRYDAPPGTRAVWMDWQEWGYDDEDLPLVVNVPAIHLELGAASPAAMPEKVTASSFPKLEIMPSQTEMPGDQEKADTTELSDKVESPDTPDKNDAEQSSEFPKLRLI